jgi:protein-S-isoprenylcysteine O-methyltransferase Ste14
MALRVWAAGHLGRAGRAREVGAPALVTSGPYRFVRNPLYLGNFLLVLGSLVALGSRWWIDLAVLLLFSVEYSLIVRAEEKELSERFGKTYLDYQQRVPAIVPRRPLPSPPPSFAWSRARGELSTLAILAAVYLLAWLKLARDLPL